MIRVPRMPDVTAAQRLALAQLLVGLVVALGVPMNATKQAELVGDVSGAFALLVIADGWIRHSRAKHVAPTLIELAAEAPREPFFRGVKSPAAIAERVAESGRSFAAAELANGPQPPPGTYPLEDGPVDTATPPPTAGAGPPAPPGDASPAPPGPPPVAAG